MRVGLCGLGLMGRRMAANLLAAGFRVTAWNRSPRPELARVGATLVETPAAVGAVSDVVLTMVTDAAAVRRAALAADGFYATLARQPEPIHLSLETIGGEAVRALAAEAGELGIGLVGAPVSGGTSGAEAGTLAIMASGRRELCDRLQPIFEVLGEPAKYAWCGEDPGLGPDLKLDNNLNLLDGLVTVYLSCLGAMQSGLDPAVAYRVFLASTGDSVAMRGRCWLPGAAPNNPVDRGFEPIYKLKDALKDLHLWADRARRQGLPLGRVQETIDIYEEAMRLGYAELDCSAILNVILQRAGLPALRTILDPPGL